MYFQVRDRDNKAVITIGTAATIHHKGPRKGEVKYYRIASQGNGDTAVPDEFWDLAKDAERLIADIYGLKDKLLPAQYRSLYIHLDSDPEPDEDRFEM